MVITLNKYYYGYPICYESYEVSKKSIYINLINIRNLTITEVKITYGLKECILNCNSNAYKITLELQDVDTEMLKTPSIEYVIADGKKYIWADYTTSQQLSKPRSISFLGKERYLYKRNLKKKLNCNKDNIKVIHFEGPDYWICTCGHINYGTVDTCLKCNIKKKELFSIKTIYEKEALETTAYFKANTLYAIWAVLLYMAYFIIQMTTGDFLFVNELKNSFFGVWHRVIAPLAIIVVTVGLLFSMMKYQEVFKKICIISRHILIFYLNFMLCFFSIATAYSTLFVIGIDIIAVSYLVYTNRSIEKSKLYEYICYSLSVLLLCVAGIKLINFSKYELTVIEGGIALNVYTDQEIYNVPEHFDNLKVKKISFDKDYDYRIKQLNISKNLTTISIYSNAVLPKLETITLNENNKSFNLRDQVLYNQSNKIQLVPITVKKLEIDYEVLDKNALHYTLGLEEIVIKSTVKEIKNNALYGCPNLERIIFEDNSQLNLIGDYAFGECGSLESIAIPKSVQSMGVGILYGCVSLKEFKSPFLGFKREEIMDDYSASDLLMKSFGSGDYKCSYYIPESLEKVEIYDITMVHNVTFYEAKNIKYIILPDELDNLGIRSFYGCESLMEFKIPNGVEVIKTSCFENCKSLEKIIIPSSVKTIDANAFKGCNSLTEVIYLGDVSLLTIAEGNEVIKNLIIK